MIYGYLALGLFGLLVALLGRKENIRELGRPCGAAVFVLLIVHRDMW